MVYSRENTKVRKRHRADARRGLRVLAIALWVISCLLPSIANATTLYRWNDNNGNPVMSDRPPPVGTTYTTIDSSRYGGGSTKPVSAVPQAPINDQARATTSSIAPSEVAQKDPALCSQAKDSIFKLETFARIRTTDDDGTVRFLSDAERDDRLQRAESIAAAYCEG